MTVVRKILLWLMRAFLSIILLAALCAGIVVGWLYLYTFDLPDASSLAAFAPERPVTIAATVCNDTAQIIAIPAAGTEKLRSAMLASDGDFDPRGVFWSYLSGVYSDDRGPRYGIYSAQLARQMFYEHNGSMLKREFRELRTAIQLERHFSNDQILTIYMNRAYFGPGIYGVENAAETYFGRQAGDVSAAQAALLAGLRWSPSRFSPKNDPDRAMQRRKEVIEAMAQRGAISQQEAVAAKLTPLEITSR